MPSKVSAGLLPYRIVNGTVEVLLAHYGGPFFVHKDAGAWTVVKGETRQTQSQNPNEATSVAGRSPAPKADSAEPSNQQEVDRLSGAGGEVEGGEDLLQTAKREFTEETGIDISRVAEFIPLGEIKQKGGKTIHAWAFDSGKLSLEFVGVSQRSVRVSPQSFFEMEWPPRSGQIQQFPEIDRAEFFPLETARQKINQAQVVFLERLENYFSKMDASYFDDRMNNSTRGIVM